MGVLVYDPATGRPPPAAPPEQLVPPPPPPSPQPPGVGVGEDVLKSGASGAARGVIGMPGMVGSARDLAAHAVEWLANKTLGPMSDERRARAQAQIGAGIPNPLDYAPTSAGLVNAADQATGGQLGINYQPQTWQGEYARTLGENLPNMAIAPGSIPAKIAQTATPALLSETAGQVAREVAPSYEGAVRVAAPFLGARSFKGETVAPTSPGLAKAAITAATRAAPSGVEALGTTALGYPGLLLARGARPLYEPALRGIRSWASQPRAMAGPTTPGQAGTAAALLSLQSAYPNVTY